MGDEEKVEVYHYTDKKSAEKIAKSGTIQQSSDGLGGKGVYFTTMDPGERKGKIAENNYDGMNQTHAENKYQEGQLNIS